MQNSGGKNFGELAIFNFWQGKHWQMLDPVKLAGGKLWRIIHHILQIVHGRKVSWVDQ